MRMTVSIQTIAEELAAAEATRRPIPPLTTTYPDIGITEAYAIQAQNIHRRVDEGAIVRGRKVGLTGLAMQRMLGVDEPDYGVLLDDMFVDEGDAVPSSTLIAPRIEAEIALLMGQPLEGPGVTVATALTAIAGAMPALELIDSRIADWKIGLIDTVADNASSARVVLGGHMLDARTLDLRLTGMVFERNGEVVETGAGGAVLGNPVRCVAWLANKLAEFGEGLRAGDVVLAGALHRAVEVAPGDVFCARFDRLGSVTTRFDRG
jgi:2-keto-4-pentenoate hydratase